MPPNVNSQTAKFKSGSLTVNFIIEFRSKSESVVKSNVVVTFRCYYCCYVVHLMVVTIRLQLNKSNKIYQSCCDPLYPYHGLLLGINGSFIIFLFSFDMTYTFDVGGLFDIVSLFDAGCLFDIVSLFDAGCLFDFDAGLFVAGIFDVGFFDVGLGGIGVSNTLLSSTPPC